MRGQRPNHSFGAVEAAAREAFDSTPPPCDAGTGRDSPPAPAMTDTILTALALLGLILALLPAVL
ncbi:hypothetical protein MKK75_26040, partial [Methylobacterium sp. J-030]|uniref:hypothetical protein n=1 Tax=Methylobacterium sp. J-030 TaxID=2836627 RepID=UPI001FBB6F08